MTSIGRSEGHFRLAGWRGRRFTRGGCSLLFDSLGRLRFSSRLGGFETLLLEYRWSSREEIGITLGRARHYARLPETVEIHHLVTPTAHLELNQYPISIASNRRCRLFTLTVEIFLVKAAARFVAVSARREQREQWRDVGFQDWRERRGDVKRV